jgi:hypothetical protein
MRPVREILPLALLAAGVVALALAAGVVALALAAGVVALALAAVLVKAPRLPARSFPAADPALLRPLLFLLAGLIALAWARSWDVGRERGVGYAVGGALIGLAAVAALLLALAR